MTMKKKFLLLSLVLMVGSTLFFSSCGKDKACRCEDEYDNKENFDKYDMEDYRVDNCADLEKELEEEYEDKYDESIRISCDPRD